MAKIVKNEKNFKVIKLSQEEAKQLQWGIDGEGKCLCMHCNEIIKGDIYFPIVLNDTMDKECYEEWLKTAINYPEDRQVEEWRYKRFLEMLDIEEE